MENESKIYAFIKAVENKYFDSFINNGEICMCTAKYFREYEKEDDNIGDSGECAIATCANGSTVQFADPIENYNSEEELHEKFKNSDWTEPFPCEKLRIFDEKNPNILSLYAITIPLDNIKEHQYIIPQKFIDEFSNHRFLLIKSPRIFIERLSAAIINSGRSAKGSIVKYYRCDDRIRHNLTTFDKQDSYSYQNEYRLIFQDINPEKQIFNIGSLDDICIEIDLNAHYYTGKFNNIDLSIMSEEASLLNECK